MVSQTAVQGRQGLGRRHPLHVGRQTIVLATEIRDDAGQLVAYTTQTQAVLPARTP